MATGLGILSANVALVYGLLHWRSHNTKPVFVEPFVIHPNPNWSDKAQLAWDALQPLTERRQTETDFFTDSRKALKLTNEVLTLVERHFHADSKYPVLDKIPGSHAVRVGDLLRAKQAVDTLNKLKSVFDFGNWLFNWSGAALAKARGLLFTKGLNTVTNEISQRLISAYITKLGYYAIQLYSGQLTLDDIVPTNRLTSASKEDIT